MCGGVAQMVERALSMREVPGSMPGTSTLIFFSLTIKLILQNLIELLFEQPKLDNLKYINIEVIIYLLVVKYICNKNLDFVFNIIYEHFSNSI